MSKKITLGRKPALSARQQQRIVALSGTETFSLRQLAVMCGVSAMTICRIIKRGGIPEQEVGQIANQQQTITHNMRSRTYSSYG